MIFLGLSGRRNFPNILPIPLLDDDDDDDDEPETYDVWPNQSSNHASGFESHYGRLHDQPHFGHPHHDFDQVPDDFFQMTIDEFMYPPSGVHPRRRASNNPWHQLVTGSVSRLASRAFGQSNNQSGSSARPNDSNSILAPLNTFHPLLNRTNQNQASTSSNQDAQRRDRPGMPLRMPGMSANYNHPNLLVRSHHLFSSRFHLVPPNPSRLHHVIDGTRNAPQRSTALVFEDLVPDLQWAQLDPEVSTKMETLFPNAFFR